MKFLKYILFSIVLLIAFTAHAQLPIPNLNVDVTNESCSGAGQLTFNLTNTAPGATILYSVFLLPEVNVPQYSVSTNSVSLPAGIYNVVAVQTLGSESNYVRVDNIVVEDLVDEPQFVVSQENNPCGGGSQVVVTVLEGEATRYEISSGPVRVPPQSSSIFPGLPQGDYIVRVYDICGTGFTRSFTVSAPDSSPPAISGPVFEESITTGCESVLVTNTLSYNQGTILVYPLTIVYTLHPGDGSPDQVFRDVITSGDSDSIDLVHEFALEPGRTDRYDIQVTNGCGIVFPPREGMVTRPSPRVSISKTLVPCGQYFITVTARNFSPPYTIEFLSPPVADFNPVRFNEDHGDGLYESVTVYGSAGRPVPVGIYTVQITDECLRTARATIDVIYEKPLPNLSGFNNGCYATLGYFTANIPERRIVSAEIVRGPSGFTEATPYDVTSFIRQDGSLRVPDLPLGEYYVTLIDDCGETYEEEYVLVPDFGELDFAAETQPDCEVGFGGVRVESNNGDLVFMEVTLAPDEFNEGVTPLDVSEFIGAGGDLYLDNLPAGAYRFEGMDTCGIERVVNIDVVGARATVSSSVVPEPRCNSFNLTLNDRTAVASATYWLQQENPEVPGEWRNPATGALYAEGTVPNNTNSIRLLNSQENVNLDYFGTFRVVKSYEAIGSGVPVKNCISVLGDPFTYENDFRINNVYVLSCSDRAGDVYIDATGLGPLRYRIRERNGVEYNRDNGGNPIFSGLSPGIYKFEVEDACTARRNDTRDITIVPDLVVANDADDMQICVESGDSPFQEFNLEERTAQILGEQSPVVYTVTYHRNRADAESGDRPLESPYTNTSNLQIIYARVIHNFINICPDITSFRIATTVTPSLPTPEPRYICIGQGPIIINVDAGYDDYVWTSDRPFNQIADNQIEISQPGTYSVTVSNITGSLPPCSASTEFEVLESEVAQNITFDNVDWTVQNNIIRVNVGTSGDYEYSLDGENFQRSNEFTGLNAGIFTVYINDAAGCGLITKEVVLLNYPKFFTPNGDGMHETWFIEFSRLEPEMVVYIYDRFGKLIKSFDAQGSGWDGTYNGKPLPATDYWFVVNRKDGRTLKGHFSLIR